jgi:hypothetical protein
VVDEQGAAAVVGYMRNRKVQLINHYRLVETRTKYLDGGAWLNY